MDEIDRINVQRWLTYIRKSLRKSLCKSLEDPRPGWDPDEAYQIISRTIEKNLPPDSGIKVKKLTREQLIALRLMGKDLRRTLHLEVGFTPPVGADKIDLRFSVGNNTL